MARKKLSRGVHERTLSANSHVCCVCKRRGIGVNVHHIDHDPGNNSPENLAVLCVAEHDAHHRPSASPALAHLDLSADAIRRYKSDWESFVAEAAKPEPAVLAVVNLYGSSDSVHSGRLLLQWPDGRIALQRTYHLLDGSPETWADAFAEEINCLGSAIKVALVSSPLEVEYCPDCHGSLCSTIKPGVARMMTANDWSERSAACVYINPAQASLAIHIAYREEAIVSASLHKCGSHLHLAAEEFEQRTPIGRRPSVRTQVTALVTKFLAEWRPGRTFIGTGAPNDPELIEQLRLPKCWESRAA
jgi:hypothetical protein